MKKISLILILMMVMFSIGYTETDIDRDFLDNVKGKTAISSDGIINTFSYDGTILNISTDDANLMFTGAVSANKANYTGDVNGTIMYCTLKINKNKITIAGTKLYSGQKIDLPTQKAILY